MPVRKWSHAQRTINRQAAWKSTQSKREYARRTFCTLALCLLIDALTKEEWNSCCMAAELLREGAKNTVALLSTLPSVSRVLQTCCGYVVTSAAEPSAITLGPLHQEFQQGYSFAQNRGVNFVQKVQNSVTKPTLNYIYIYEHFSTFQTNLALQKANLAPVQRLQWLQFKDPCSGGCIVSLLIIQPATIKIHVLLLFTISH